MPTPTFFTVLRDVAKLASAAADDLATQSVKFAAAADDIAVLTGKATAKTAGVAGDDLAVGAGQVGGLSPSRELPAIWRIAKASFVNKLWLAATLLLLFWVLPEAITVALVLGGLFLAFEGGEGLLELFPAKKIAEAEPVLSEDEKVKGAIRTDLVLSLEILVIALASVDAGLTLGHKAAVLLGVAFIMTLAVYGLITLLIRLDDMGLALAKSPKAALQSTGRIMAKGAPVILRALGPIGMAAMFAVAGGIFTHLVHLEVPGGFLAGLGVDILVGVVVGLALAGIAHVGHALWARRRHPEMK